MAGTREEILKAMANLSLGNNTNVQESLTTPLYDTVTLTTGNASKYNFFDKSRADKGSDYGITNNSQGGRVPSKQSRIVDAIKISVLTPTALTDAFLAELNTFLFNSSFIAKFDDSTKLETTLTGILGADFLVQGAAAVGTSVGSGFHQGVFKLRENWLMGAETQFEFYFENKQQATVSANINGIKIRIELLGTLYRLVA